jgi:hypothetical protein
VNECGCGLLLLVVHVDVARQILVLLRHSTYFPSIMSIIGPEPL